jgi:hypothetical protein
MISLEVFVTAIILLAYAMEIGRLRGKVADLETGIDEALAEIDVLLENEVDRDDAYSAEFGKIFEAIQYLDRRDSSND